MSHGFLSVSPEEYARAAEIARDVLNLSKNTVRIRMRFLDGAMNHLEAVLHPEIAFATDGTALYFEPFSLLKRYKDEAEAMSRNYLHVLLHCLLRHMYLHRQVEEKLWDLACDITVESILDGLGFSAGRQEGQREILENLRQDVKHFTAEHIYRHYRDQHLKPGQIREIRKHFRVDDHGLWYQENGFSTGGGGQMEKQWEEISRHVQGDLQTFSRNRGEESASLLQNLTAVNREKYDYTVFLRRFAARQEEMKVDDEEFDYIFYTYGLKLYEKMPLVEPLEYKEIKKIREFVVAVDTSGSVSGELVQAFIQKTYNILKSTESFATKVNIHIIQCDKEIQEDVKITNGQEFEGFLENMTLKGFGGTDFRPVFAHVEQLRKSHEFTNLRGLLYFTDGLGTFPEKKPDYDTVFLFLDEEYRDIQVPSWAMKLMLEREDLEQ